MCGVLGVIPVIYGVHDCVSTDWIHQLPAGGSGEISQHLPASICTTQAQAFVPSPPWRQFLIEEAIKG